MDTPKNQLPVVTGASSGIGRAIALSFTKQGAEVCLVARRREALQAVAEHVHASGGRGHVCRADLTNDDDIASMVAHALCLPRTAEVTDISIRP